MKTRTKDQDIIYTCKSNCVYCKYYDDSIGICPSAIEYRYSDDYTKNIFKGYF